MRIVNTYKQTNFHIFRWIIPINNEYAYSYHNNILGRSISKMYFHSLINTSELTIVTKPNT